MSISCLGAVLLLQVSGIGVQDAPKPSAEAILDKCIEQSLAWNSFDASYEIETPEHGRMSLRMLYRAPDSGLVHMQRAGSDVWISFHGHTYEMCSKDSDGVLSGARADCGLLIELMQRMDDTLARGFPTLKGRISRPPNLLFGVDPTWSEELGKYDMSINLSVDLHAPERFSYLGALRSQSGGLEVTDTEILMHDEHGLEIAVDRRTGLLVRVIDRHRENASVRLLSSKTNEAIPDSAFEVPEPTVVDEGFRDALGRFSETLGQATRLRLYEEVSASDVCAGMEWTPARSAAVAEAFGAYHLQLLAVRASRSTEPWHEVIEKAGAYFDGKLAAASAAGQRTPEFLAKLKEEVGAKRSELSQVLADGLHSYSDDHATPDIPGADEACIRRIFAIETEAARAAFTERLIDPILREWDTRVVIPGD